MNIDFDDVVFRWEARTDSDWFFTAVPAELSELIREIPRPTRGLGSVRVDARVGLSAWRTSIFPSADGRYWLPLKRSVRDAEHLVEDGPVSVALMILDV
ncbi:DUF1905 domain-containing protein [Microbacterium sp. 1P10UB]|uniref:DUF1905 domain-containing protein n=1 Tax=unclassified Microbacterium TaxID=2609290 RepID=UPI0039A196CC